MAIILRCPGCSTRLTIDDDRAGTVFDCPNCDSAINVPLPATPIPATPVPDSADSSPTPTKFCHECGKSIRKKAAICPECGVRQPRTKGRRTSARSDPTLQHANGKKLAAGLCGIFIGGLGIHKFVLGLNKPGLIMLLVSLLSCGIGYPIIHIIGLVEGILYLTKSDEEFDEIYLVEKKEWF